MPLAIHLVRDGVNVLSFDIVLEFRAGVRERLPDPLFLAVFARFLGCLKARPVIRRIGGAFLNRQARTAEAIGRKHLSQRLPQVSYRRRVPAWIGAGIPEL